MGCDLTHIDMESNMIATCTKFRFRPQKTYKVCQSWVTGLDFRALSRKCDQGENVLIMRGGGVGTGLKPEKGGREVSGEVEIMLRLCSDT